MDLHPRAGSLLCKGFQRVPDELSHVERVYLHARNSGAKVHDLLHCVRAVLEYLHTLQGVVEQLPFRAVGARIQDLSEHSKGRDNACQRRATSTIWMSHTLVPVGPVINSPSSFLSSA